MVIYFYFDREKGKNPLETHTNNDLAVDFSLIHKFNEPMSILFLLLFKRNHIDWTQIAMCVCCCCYSFAKLSPLIVRESYFFHSISLQHGYFPIITLWCCLSVRMLTWIGYSPLALHSKIGELLTETAWKTVWIPLQLFWINANVIYVDANVKRKMEVVAAGVLSNERWPNWTDYFHAIARFIHQLQAQIYM